MSLPMRTHTRSTLLSGLVLAAAAPLASAGFYGDPPDATHPWAIHDENRPQPPRVEPGDYSSQEKPGKPPSDAIILFDGTPATLANWVSNQNPGEPTKWVVQDGSLQCVPGAGYVRTKQEWGDCQLHVEWSAPTKAEGSSQGRGNSGIFPMGQVEVQVLDNFNNPTYADGFAGSVYGVNPPLANAVRAPGTWQVYDIVFRRPVFKDGKMIEDGYLTVFVNGVLTQDHTPLEGGGGHRARSHNHPFPEKGPLQLQDHGNPVRYRNIWYRPLPARASEGGDVSHMSEAATAAKRAQIAAGLREEASKLQGKDKMLKQMESLVYTSDAATLTESTKASADFLASVKDLSGDKLEAQKGAIRQVHGALNYLSKFKILPAALPEEAALAGIIDKAGWNDKK
ncbi:MAG: hypothetical protein JWL81_2306 [Verrucomicrobiales bacterium]|nr:hypothetical protein [Verrucomicrobiales bacterium]